MARLTLTTESGATHSLDLEKKHYTIGRARDCDVQIGDLSLSGHHARIERREDKTWYLIDLNSTNGSKVNGIAVTQEHPLTHDDTIALGDVTGFFTDLAGTARTRTLADKPPATTSNIAATTTATTEEKSATEPSANLHSTNKVASTTPQNTTKSTLAWNLVILLGIAVFALSFSLFVALLLLWKQ